jgi:DNA-binding transcriptional LysR family regulator
MFELNQLEQLLIFAKCETLSKAAEHLHISQPALSRSMRKLEEKLHVTLFERQKNKIELNPNGQLAVEYAEKVLDQSRDMMERVRAFDRSRHTFSAGYCAPAPLWEISPLLSNLYPEMTISSEMKDKEHLLQGLRDGVYQIIVVHEPTDEDDIYCTKYGEEHLFFSLPPIHPLSERKELYFKDLDGENMLLRSKIGFWNDIPIKKMPAAHFFVQDDSFAFNSIRQVKIHRL